MFVKSKFNVETLPELGVLLIFNTRTGAIVTLNDVEQEIWVNNRLSELPPDTKEYLKENSFIVEKGFDESGSVLDEYRVNCRNPSEHRYRIMVTSCCNARCPYCFEKGIKMKHMSDETVSAVSAFINKSSKKYGKIAIEWFGGEPLMNQSAIRRIYRSVAEANPDSEIVCSVVTNGSLIDDDAIDLFKEIGLSFIQISLDGMAELYNSTKLYVDSRHNFVSVMDNIGRLIENGYRPHIRINTHDGIISDALELIDYLHDRFGNKITLYCGRLFCYDSNGKRGSPVFDSLILKKTIEYGYTNPEYLLKRMPVPCGLASFESYSAIDPDGRLVKCCESMTVTDKCFAGDVINGLKKDVVELWQEPVSSPECLECRFLPLCMGGCKAAQLGFMSDRCFKKKDQVELILKHIYERQKMEGGV